MAQTGSRQDWCAHPVPYSLLAASKGAPRSLTLSTTLPSTLEFLELGRQPLPLGGPVWPQLGALLRSAPEGADTPVGAPFPVAPQSLSALAALFEEGKGHSPGVQ